MRYDEKSSDPLRALNKRGRIFSKALPQIVEHFEILKDSIADIPEVREKLYPTEPYPKLIPSVNNRPKLVWGPYSDSFVLQYLIYRDEYGLGNFTQIEPYPI